MKALTLHQPWASLIALGVKTIETRSWSTKYRGPLAIHAGKRCEVGKVGHFDVEDDTPPRSAKQYLLRGVGWPYRVPLGCVVATCELVDVVPILLDTQPWEGAAVTATSNRPPHYLSTAPYPSLVRWPGGEERGIDVSDQRPYGDFRPGRFAHLLGNIQALPEPIPCRGMQALWNLPADIEERIAHGLQARGAQL